MTGNGGNPDFFVIVLIYYCKIFGAFLYLQNAPVHRPFYVEPKYDRLSISMKTDFRIFVCLLPAVVLSGCKTPRRGRNALCQIDYAEYSFRAAGNQPLVVEVRTSPAEWSAESDASWCRYTEDEFGLTITVDDNVAGGGAPGGDNRYRGHGFAGDRGVAARRGDGCSSRYRYMIDYFGGVISPNGKWFGALLQRLRRERQYHQLSGYHQYRDR